MHAVLSLLGLFLVLSCSVRAAKEGDIRLMHNYGNILQNCGRVEVFHNGSWGTVCHNSWNKRDADVVCRQLGYKKGSRFRCHSACFGQGNGKIWMDNLACPPNGNKLMLCEYREWGEHDCSHAEDAGVCCKGYVLPPLRQTSDTRVRITCPCAADGGCSSCTNKLRPAPGDCDLAIEGMVEISFGDLWIPVDEDAWDMNAARVACGELGYPSALTTSEAVTSEFCTEEEKAGLAGSSGISSHVVKSVQCSGSESLLANCSIKTGSGSACFSAAKLRCGHLPHPDCPHANMTHRLRAGAVPWRGRLEVKKDGMWGTVHDSMFGSEEADVACHAAGYGSAVSVQSGSSYGRGIGPVHYQDTRCTGDETSLSQCESTPGGGLGHERDVGVECCRPTPCSNPLRMAEPTSIDEHMISGYPEYSGGGGPGLLCAGVLDRSAARVTCAHTSEMFLHSTTSVESSASSSAGVYYQGSVECNGEEADLSECSVSLQTVAQCPNGLVQQLVCTSCVPDLIPDLDAFRASLTRHSSPTTSYSPAITHRSMRYLQCPLQENCLSSSAQFAGVYDQRTLLKFDSVTFNWGLCDFKPNLNREDWIFHDCHQHYHSYEAFVDFNLLDVETGEKVAEGHKASFCLEDTECATGYSLRYECSFTGEQGISPNCGDRYPRYLDCQWIDITGIDSGEYFVRQTLNPHRDAQESDFRNNEITCRIQMNVEEATLSVFECWQSDHV